MKPDSKPCTHPDYEHLEKYDTCYRGRIDARRCKCCGKVFGFVIVR